VPPTQSPRLLPAATLLPRESLASNPFSFPSSRCYNGAICIRAWHSSEAFHVLVCQCPSAGMRKGAFKASPIELDKRPVQMGKWLSKQSSTIYGLLLSSLRCCEMALLHSSRDLLLFTYVKCASAARLCIKFYYSLQLKKTKV